MNRNVLLLASVTIGLLFGGCQSYPLVRTSVDPLSIPDQPYDVTVYQGYTSSMYAVLFDIPDDGVEMVVQETRYARRMAADSPRGYIDEFNERIKHYSTIKISDEDGTVRGYLVASYVLKYWIKPTDGRIVVGIKKDPAYYRTPV